ncbi:N-alpha-acetyltransferase 16, NatA auxiliary subunit [Irineochytrium annulatum]|nr:N-alpha-acetyltransferase 16, NatA auxiliary subunit [Irineochytrium annulatum]
MTNQKALPAKEAALMKAVLQKFHENKQHKKGMKTADQILRKFPDHAETMAMKALFLSSLERKEEAHELIKKSIKLDLGNPVCWHVYGLIHRAEKNYEEALKSYTMALKYEKDNIQIFRDHAMLQIQMRNYDGFVDSNLQLVLLRPQMKSYWLSLAVSFHLMKNYPFALETLNLYHEIFQTIVEPNSAFENSEVYLYKNTVMEESGDLAKAIEHLNEIEGKVVDKKSWKEAKGMVWLIECLLPTARLLQKQGETKLAESMFKVLLRQNPDNVDYINAILKCKGLDGELDDAKTTQLFEFFEDLSDEFKRAHIIKRLPLNYATGPRFRTMADNYLRPLFRKGVPSVFISLKEMYADASKRAVIEELALGYEKSLKACGRFHAEEAHGEEDESTREPPSALLWVLYFLAQHFDHLRVGARALAFIDKAIDHTPTLVELLMTKARILKHGGDLEGAKRVMNDARERDLQDRYVNSKCTKYMLRNDNVDEAEKTIVMFCRNDSSDKLADLLDLQCMWFAFESGKSFVRQGKMGRALKKFHQIEKHFADIHDDQFDFHNYSFRKVTLRTYIDLLRMEDRLRSHQMFFNTAVEAVQIYTKLFDKAKEDELEKENISNSNMSESEKKKALRKARKAELRNADDNAVAATTSVAGATNGVAKKADDDPEGLKLLNVTDPLDEAMRFLRPLLEMSPGRVESHVHGAAVYLRRKKLLLAWRSVKIGLRIEPDHPELHKVSVQFWKEYKASSSTMPPTVSAVIDSELAIVFSASKSMVDFNSSFSKRTKGSLPHAAAALEVSEMLEKGKGKAEAAAFVGSVKEGMKGLTLENLIAAHKILLSTTGVSSPESAEKLAMTARKLYPLATYFKN